MTAFARESAAGPGGLLTVELRTVNHRYLDCSFKLPDALRALEIRLRDLAGTALARGKLDCLMRLQAHPSLGADLQVDEARLDRLLEASRLVTARCGGETRPFSALEVLQFPGILQAREDSEEELQAAAEALFRTALESLAANRAREGEKLGELVRDRLQQLEAAVAATRALLPELQQQQRDRILARIEELRTGELRVEPDRGRIEQEMVHLAQRADVAEELDRLQAHIAEVGHTLDQGSPCGRRLDFLMQELNREANTLSSKSMATGTTQQAVDMKVLIEQMREQVQNIE